jgi:hypothetical protein
MDEKNIILLSMDKKTHNWHICLEDLHPKKKEVMHHE